MKRTKFPSDDKDRVLVIDLNEEYKVKVEKPDDLEKSYFEKIYKKAGKSVLDILVKSEEAEKLDNNNPFYKQEQEYNNIITFCGERGTGKSSAMISFASSLVNFSKTGNFYKDFSILRNYKFYPISTIDPSMFEEKENIFEVVLAQLFSSFEKELNNNQNKNDLEVKREILDLFQKVFENLKTIQKNGEKYSGEALETLSKLSCGANLRDNFCKLVLKYLEFVKPEREDKACLIIPIDDFDLNINAVADMAEQIRKYLMIPNVLILMAADMKKLSDAKEQSVRKEFETLLKSKAMTESPRSITSKYILKLIPNNRRLTIPQLNHSLFDNKFVFIDEMGVTTYENIFSGVQDQLFKKTNLFISVREFNDIEIFPKTLRELKEFFILLSNLKKPGDFVDYIISLYKEFPNNRSHILEEFIIRPGYEKNQYIIKELIECIITDAGITKNEFGRLVKDSLTIFELIKREANSYNVNLGDLLFVFKILEESEFNIKYKNLFNSIKLIYSCLLSTYASCKQYDKILQLTNGNAYSEFYKEVIRGSRSRFPIHNFEKKKFNNISIAGAFANKLSPENIKVLEWLGYFIEYPKNSLYKNDKVPYYTQGLEIGRGTLTRYSPIFNVLQILTSSLDPELNFERVFDSYYENLLNKRDEEYHYNYENSMVSEMNTWLNNHTLIFPFSNLFLYEDMLWNIDTDLKDRQTSFSPYVYFLLNQIRNYLEDLEMNEKIMRDQNVVESFDSCPILIPIMVKDVKYNQLLDILWDNTDTNDEDTNSTMSLNSWRDSILKSRRRNPQLLIKDILKSGKDVLDESYYEELSQILHDPNSGLDTVRIVKGLIEEYISIISNSTNE